MKKMIAIVFAVVLSSNIYAAGTEEFTITEVGVTRGGNYVFLNIIPNESVSTCSRHNQLRWEMTDSMSDAMLSIALTAHASGKKVKVGIADNDCLGDSPRPGSFTIIN